MLILENQHTAKCEVRTLSKPAHKVSQARLGNFLENIGAAQQWTAYREFILRHQTDSHRGLIL